MDNPIEKPIILIVDDSHLMREFTSLWLSVKNPNIEIIEASSGEEAV